MKAQFNTGNLKIDRDNDMYVVFDLSISVPVHYHETEESKARQAKRREEVRNAAKEGRNIPHGYIPSDYFYTVGDTDLSPQEFITEFVKMFTSGKICIVPAEAADE